MLFILRKVLEINNSNENIENVNLNNLIVPIGSSLRFSMGQGDLKMAILNKEKDIIFAEKTIASSVGNFKEICKTLK